MPDDFGPEGDFKAVIGISLLGAFLPFRAADLKPLRVADPKVQFKGPSESNTGLWFVPATP
jgi:hypothetical protein